MVGKGWNGLETCNNIGTCPFWAILNHFGHFIGCWQIWPPPLRLGLIWSWGGGGEICQHTLNVSGSNLPALTLLKIFPTENFPHLRGGGQICPHPIKCPKWSKMTKKRVLIIFPVFSSSRRVFWYPYLKKNSKKKFEKNFENFYPIWLKNDFFLFFFQARFFGKNFKCSTW